MWSPPSLSVEPFFRQWGEGMDWLALSSLVSPSNSMVAAAVVVAAGLVGLGKLQYQPNYWKEGKERNTAQAGFLLVPSHSFPVKGVQSTKRQKIPGPSSPAGLQTPPPQWLLGCLLHASGAGEADVLTALSSDSSPPTPASLAGAVCATPFRWLLQWWCWFLPPCCPSAGRAHLATANGGSRHRSGHHCCLRHFCCLMAKTLGFFLTLHLR